MPIERFTRSELVATQWKNGGGLTREIVRRPRASEMDSFDWRVSIAEISASGAFSPFEGVDRVIVLLSGDGVRLKSADGRIDHGLHTPLAPFSFSGDEAIEASLVGSVSTDFNVMTRRSAAHAEVRVVRTPTTLTVSEAGVLFVGHGAWRATATGNSSSGGNTFTLDADAGVWWDEAATTWHLTPLDDDAAIIAVTVSSTDDAIALAPH